MSIINNWSRGQQIIIWWNRPDIAFGDKYSRSKCLDKCQIFQHRSVCLVCRWLNRSFIKKAEDKLCIIANSSRYAGQKFHFRWWDVIYNILLQCRQDIASHVKFKLAVESILLQFANNEFRWEKNRPICSSVLVGGQSFIPTCTFNQTAGALYWLKTTSTGTNGRLPSKAGVRDRTDCFTVNIKVSGWVE